MESISGFTPGPLIPYTKHTGIYSYDFAPYLQSSKEVEMLPHCQSIIEHIVLWTQPKTLSDIFHVSDNTVSIDDSITTGGREQSH